MHQPSQTGPTEVVNFRLPRRQATALRHLADVRGVALGTLVRDQVTPLVTLAVDLDQLA